MWKKEKNCVLLAWQRSFHIRALPWIARAETGKFFIVDGPGASVYFDELIDFTGIEDTHDDQVDWTSGAYMLLAGESEPELEVLGEYEMGWKLYKGDGSMGEVGKIVIFSGFLGNYCNKVSFLTSIYEKNKVKL